MKTQNKFALLGLLLVMALPLISAYEVRSTMAGLNLWDLLVEYTFGNFWITAIALCVLYFIILIFGGISPLTSLMFLSCFMVAMSMGYSYQFIASMIFATSCIFFTWQLVRWIYDAYG